jgi:uncharacterized membrane protein YvlD (DUF360 family)
MLIKLIVIFVVFCALLYLLNKIMPDFQIEMGAIPVVALILVGVNYATTWLFGAVNFLTLGIVKWLLTIVTLGLFGLLAGFIMNIIIFWIADKLTDRLTIKSTKTLLVSAFALQITTYLLHKFI